MICLRKLPEKQRANKFVKKWSAEVNLPQGLLRALHGQGLSTDERISADSFHIIANKPILESATACWNLSMVMLLATESNLSSPVRKLK